MHKDIAALVGSRICHDLISPIGAIGNGVELIGLTNNVQSPEMALISESVDNANARIRFFRVAFGSADSNQVIARSEVVSILTSTAKSGRFSYDWQVTTDEARRDVRIAFLLLQCFETAFPIGADITVIKADGLWAFNAQGQKMLRDQSLWDSLQQPDNDFPHSAAQVQFAMLPDVLKDADRTLQVTLGENAITATVG